MRVELQPAWVLHRRPFRESSLIIEAFSQSFGRIGLLARGARRPRSRLRGELQPFRPLLVSWSGRGELPVLTGADPRAVALGLNGDALAAGFYVNELLMRLLPRHDPHEDLFGHYQDLMKTLATAPLAAQLRIFEMQLLQSLGWGLMLDQDCHGQALRGEAHYFYDPEQGPVPRKQGQGTVAGESMLALAEQQLHSEQQLRDCQRVTRTVIAHHLGGEPLRSRELLVRPAASPMTTHTGQSDE